jgi:sulfite dehydrogenase (quinone) subunit SoeC
MHPAFSVIFLTTLIGVGQGFFLALYTGQVYALAHLLPAQDSRSFYALGSAIAVIFLIAGLIASFFHLGRPERAWRAATQWRTSWLSREVIILPITLALIAAYGALHYFGWNPLLFTWQNLNIDLSLFIGALATLATFALFICTAMIYAGVRFIQEWHSPLTVLNYILLGGASGFTLAAAFTVWSGGELLVFYGAWAVILTFAALLSRGASLWRNAHIKRKSNLQSAIGMRHTVIAQKSQGAMGGSFNTREFFHGKSERTVKAVRVIFLILVFFVPVVLLGAAYGLGSEFLPLSAFLAQYVGLLAERWYFFAEARHPQNLYYQTCA